MIDDDDYGNPPLLPELEAPDNKPVKTGLLDRYGRPLYRLPRQVGFKLPKARA
jgi:hypothetical protein